jgi:NAD(P)-dependent dehydrogenase (short-subunit alcohol dehydrogenase family)
VPFDPARWRIPDRPIPASYLSFLRWSDGGEFQTGDRFGTAPEIADVVAFLASPDARWVTGELLGATGGLRG